MGRREDRRRQRVCFPHLSRPPLEGITLSGSLLFVDPKIRKVVEQDVVITLAGIVAAEIWRPVAQGYRPEPATSGEVERLTFALREAGYVERVERWAATPPLELRSDEEHVFRVGIMWSGSEQAAAAFVRWTLAETVALVRSREFAEPLAAVTEALLGHGELPGHEVHRIVAGRPI